MSGFCEILGQDQALFALKQAIVAEKIAHAYLFSGPQGVGKTTTAIAFARALNCRVDEKGDGCGKCDDCYKIGANAHPDLIIVEPDGAYIKIDQVRPLEQLIKFPPHEGRYRVIIIDDAGALNLNAANALLKS
ncbi:MAG: AAA family ATPase, partial [Pseudomonadota bacterium]